jgi:disabled family protein 2
VILTNIILTLQDCLYHHPVHKISFIAQDMSDSRAFGYIYGSPENGHRFFGIKTEKAAGQVVVAMRDLFQVVFELKQKEIDDTIRKMDKDKQVIVKLIRI